MKHMIFKDPSGTPRIGWMDDNGIIVYRVDSDTHYIIPAYECTSVFEVGAVFSFLERHRLPDNK